VSVIWTVKPQFNEEPDASSILMKQILVQGWNKYQYCTGTVFPASMQSFSRLTKPSCPRLVLSTVCKSNQGNYASPHTVRKILMVERQNGFSFFSGSHNRQKSLLLILHQCLKFRPVQQVLMTSKVFKLQEYNFLSSVSHDLENVSRLSTLLGDLQQILFSFLESPNTCHSL